MAKVLTFDEFMNESYEFHQYGNDVKEIEYYDSATEIFEGEINSFLGINDTVYEAKAVTKEDTKKAFQYITKPEDINTIKTELKTGSQGADVKKLQSLMGVVTDGIFGSETRGGIKKWQQISGIKVDGIFRPEDAEKYIKAVKSANVEKASKEAKKIADVAFDPKDTIILKGIEEVKIIKVGQNTYVIITPSANVKDVAKEAKEKGSKGYDFLAGLSLLGGSPAILIGGKIYKASKSIVNGMVGALSCLGEKTYDFSCNVWSGILEFGKHINSKGKDAWKDYTTATTDFYSGFVNSCNTAAKKSKESIIAQAALFVYFYNQSKKSFKEAGNFLNDVVTKAYKGATIAGEKITDNIKNSYSASVSYLKDQGEKAKNVIKSGVESAKNLAIKSGEKAINTAKKIGDSAVQLGTKAVKKTTKFVDDIGMAFYNLLFEYQEFGDEKSIFENYTVLKNGEKYYVPTWIVID